MVLAKVSAKAVVRDAVAVISAALLPGTVIGFPVLRAMLVPSRVLDALLFGSASSRLIALSFGML